MKELQVGSKIYVPAHGVGLIKQINYSSITDFYFYVDFCRKGGDGTKVWLPKRYVERMAKRVKN